MDGLKLIAIGSGNGVGADVAVGVGGAGAGVAVAVGGSGVAVDVGVGGTVKGIGVGSDGTEIVSPSARGWPLLRTRSRTTGSSKGPFCPRRTPTSPRRRPG